MTIDDSVFAPVAARTNLCGDEARDTWRIRSEDEDATVRRYSADRPAPRRPVRRHPHLVPATGDAARTADHHPSLATRIPTFEVLRPAGGMGLWSSYPHATPQVSPTVRDRGPGVGLDRLVEARRVVERRSPWGCFFGRCRVDLQDEGRLLSAATRVLRLSRRIGSGTGACRTSSGPRG